MFTIINTRFSQLAVWLDSALNGDEATLLQMLGEGFDVNAHNEDGLTALHNACCDGWIQVARLLLDKGAHVNAADEVT